AQVGPNRSRLGSTVDSLIANGGTALYDAISVAHGHLSQAALPDRIHAIVVLTDGDDRDSSKTLESLRSEVLIDQEGTAIRVFTIGYGSNTNEAVLEAIAEQSQAKFYKGSTEDIREVFKGISTFF
ncbi:MAG: VWA domain-containing protein, partial [Phycisphaerales bacterium]|nr:VWA domain-containing protein [Phycisphaerales bacterium]